jgi:hypothetical protein
MAEPMMQTSPQQSQAEAPQHREEIPFEHGHVFSPFPGLIGYMEDTPDSPSSDRGLLIVQLVVIACVTIGLALLL